MDKKATIPFSVLPVRSLEGLTVQLEAPGQFISHLVPLLSDSLRQAQYPYSARDYASTSLAVALVNSIFILVAIAATGTAAGSGISILGIALVASAIVFIASFGTVLLYPQVVATRRRRVIDGQLIPALRQLLIELRSGVPLFNSMASLTYDYGEVSAEFRDIVSKVNAGTPEIDALTEAASASPSDQFRKVLWQISNSLKVGSDPSDVIQVQLENLTRERIDQIRRYGQELSPWTMIYMMAAVILPSLGVAMLIVVVSFLGSPIPTIILPIILVGLAGFQVFFMSFVSSRRPQI